MALSDLPPGFSARSLGSADIASAMALSAEAGWNQVAADWRIFIENGCALAIANSDGELVATAAILPHGGRFAWISMVLVAAPYRRRGFATWLLRHCVATLLAQGLTPVLDATDTGRPLYLSFGFADCWGLHRMVARAELAVDSATTTCGITVRPLMPQDWARIVAYDTAIFGAEREKLLRRLAYRLPVAAHVAEHAGEIAGFLLGRDGRAMNQLGPLAADSENIARALLGHALASLPAPVVIDLPDRHANLRAWLIGMGFSAERPLTRMVRGQSIAFDDTSRLFAIAGPELG